MKPLETLVRPNILRMRPYGRARNEAAGSGETLLDANENPYNAPLNRYPDPLQRKLKKALSDVRQIPEECIFVGNGRHEAVDLAFRIFCEPGRDNAVSVEPTCGIYRASADMNAVEYRAVGLESDFSFKAGRLLEAADGNTKLIFLCTPNSPTGNLLPYEEIVKVAEAFEGIVVIDEAYSDFSRKRAFRSELARFPNMIVLNTLSNSWGCAGLRVATAFASREITGLFTKAKYPYNINALSQREALAVAARSADVHKWVNIILGERMRLMDSVSLLPYCVKVFPSDANFFLARFSGARPLYYYLAGCGIAVRDCSDMALCADCLRITVGSPADNMKLLAAMRKYPWRQA